MTRPMVGGIAAGTLALGLLAGALIPTVFRPAHPMLGPAGMGAMPMPGSGAMPMQGTGPMAGNGATWQQHAAHHASQGGSR